MGNGTSCRKRHKMARVFHVLYPNARFGGGRGSFGHISGIFGLLAVFLGGQIGNVGTPGVATNKFYCRNCIGICFERSCSKAGLETKIGCEGVSAQHPIRIR